MSIREGETRDEPDAGSSRADQLHRLASVLLLNSTLAVGELLQLITAEARETVGAHLAVGSLASGADWSQALTAVALSDEYATRRDDGTAPNGSGVYAVVCAENRPLRLTRSQLEEDPAWPGFGARIPTNAEARRPPLQGLLAAPLIGRDGGNLGLIHLSDKEDGSEFSAEDEGILVQLTQMASAAIVNARLYEELQASRLELEAIFGAVADGITAQGPGGELMFANDAAARLVGYPTAADFLATPIAEVLERFEILDEERRPFPLADLPGRAALRGEQPPPVTLCYRVRETGEERWSIVRATPVRDGHGNVTLAINTFHDLSDHVRANERLRFLGETSALLASSLDFEQTLGRLGDLIVPAIADYCIVDLVQAGAPRRQAVLRHVDPEREAVLRAIRDRYPPEANPQHPATRVLASSEPLLITDAESAIGEAARDEEHLALYRTLDPTSYLVVPLLARGRIVGTLSLGTGESGRRYSERDVAFAQDVAGRIALGVENARLYTEVGESLALLDTLLVSSPVAIGFWDRELRFVRVNEALAAINQSSPEQHVGRTLEEVIPQLAPLLEPLYRHVLESGEPVVHEESTDESASAGGDRRHWLSSYYPVRTKGGLPTGESTEGGEIIGVGGVIMEITGQKRADARLRLLAEAGELFSSSLDRETIFGRIARVVVPEIADACNIYLGEANTLVRVAHAHADPELERLMDAMPEVYRLAEDSPAGLRAIFGGESLLVPTVTPELIGDLVRLGLDREAFARVGSRSMMFVPFVLRGETLGAMSLGSRQPGRYGEADLELALELARRASVAIENARLFGELSFRTTVLEAQQEASIDGLLLVSPEGRMLSSNRRFAELWGFSEELVGDGDDEAALAEAMQKVADPEGFSARVQYLYAHPEETSREEISLEDGRVFDRYGAAVRSPDGQYYGWLWSFRDVTEAKRTEAELARRADASQALEFIGDGVFLVDDDGIVRLWNPAAETIIGRTAQEVVGRSAAFAIPSWSAVAPLVPVSGRRAETVPLDLGGRELWLSVSGVAFPGGTVYAFRDSTEERAVERLKSDFVSTVSHELRTPLAAIYGAAMTLKRADVSLSAEQHEGMLGVVAGESERLARIVNDILLASQLDSNVVDVSIGRADPAELVRGVLAAAQAHLPPGIELSSEAPHGAPEIFADEDKVRQVLVNLVENAIKYSPDGGRVSVVLTPIGERLRISVVDEGLGIPTTEHGRIFEKFYRLDPNLTRGVGGTGLGLYICREIVHRMNGRLWVDSELGRGPTFSFDLPLAAPLAG